MILIKNVMLILIGLSSGIALAAGVFAFITMIGIIPRLAERTNTSKKVSLYEDMVLIGGTLGNIIILFQVTIPFGTIGIIIFGVFTGIFVGCLAMALAEVLNVIPVFVKRLKIRIGLPYLIIAIAIGKGVGAFIQLCMK